MDLDDLKDIFDEIMNLPVIDIIVVFSAMIVWLVGWIYTIVEVVSELIECIMCSRRKECEFLIFSEHCPKRHCLNEKERKILQEKINELDGI